jgi:hypothetical protein
MFVCESRFSLFFAIRNTTTKSRRSPSAGVSKIKNHREPDSVYPQASCRAAAMGMACGSGMWLDVERSVGLIAEAERLFSLGR